MASIANTTKSSTATSDVICIIGAKGMLGRELARACRQPDAAGRANVCELDQDEVDIADADSVSQAIGSLKPRLVVNAAAYTDVNGCESNRDLAEAVNAQGPAYLANACRANGCRLVHVSTDYVFDGRKSSAYVPADPINPLNVYGRSKADGERHVRQALPDHAIVRTSWLFGVDGDNFVKTILKLAFERSELRVVTDQIGCPTYARDLAETLITLGRSTHTGTYHFCNAGQCSWHELAVEIVRLAGANARVLPITSAELDQAAVRPAYSVLSTETLTRDVGIQPRPWPEALAECLERLTQQPKDGRTPE